MSERESQTPARDSIPRSSVLIEVHVAELKQLFNAMDPSPFRERDLDPNAEEFIVGWAKDERHDLPLAMLVHLDRAAGPSNETSALAEAIHEFFTQRGHAARRRLRELLRRGRVSLLIGLVVLAACVALADVISESHAELRFIGPLRESLLIGGWVAMWRPLEIFLYDWWPIRAEIKLYQRLSTMPVRIAYAGEARPHAWRRDWPAVAGKETRPDSTS